MPDRIIPWNTPTHCGKTPRIILIYLIAFYAVGLFPADAYMPSLPFIQHYFGMNDTTVQSSVTVYLLAMAIGSLIIGPIAHHKGRKPTLMLGCICFILGSLLCLWAPNTLGFMLGRLLQGLGATGVVTLGNTIIRDVFEGKQVVTMCSYAVPVVSFMLAVAPTMGGYLQSWFDWPGTFWFSIATFTVLLGFIWYDFPETQPKNHATDTSNTSAFLTLIKSPPFLLFCTCSGLAMSFIMAYQTMAPLLMQKVLGLSPVEFGWLGLASCIGMTVGGWVNSRFIDKIGSHGLLYLAGVLIILPACLLIIPGLFGYLSPWWAIILPFTLGLIGCMLIFTNAFMCAMDPWPHLASFAAAIQGTWQYLVASITSLAAAFAPEHNQVPMGCIWLVLGILQLIVARSAINATKKSTS